MDLVSQLNSLGMDVNAKYRYLNSGGCAVFAAIVGNELRDMGVKVKVLVCGSGDGESLDAVRGNIKNPNRKREWNKNDVFFNHVGLEFFWKRRKYHYDSNGANPPVKVLDGYPLYKGRLTVDECIGIAREPSGWNKKFNRRHIPAIRRMVRKHFAEMTAQM
jgi:hypothetical protein